MCEDVHGQCTIYIVHTVHVHVHVLDALFESTCTEIKRCMVLDNIYCKFVDIHVYSYLVGNVIFLSVGLNFLAFASFEHCGDPDHSVTHL